MLRLLELLKLNGYVPDPARVKLVRHAGDGQDMEQLAFEGWLEAYQQFQAKPVFDQCDQIIAFVGEDARTARLQGIYEVGKSEEASEAHLPAGCMHLEWIQSGYRHYPMTKKSGLHDLEQCVVIQWPGAAINWHQWLENVNPEVVELRRAGRALPPFRDFLRFDLSYRQLRVLLDKEAAHRDWVNALSSVGGIYLIVDTSDGKQYVGSATGEGGIWQRWSHYAKDGHGGNAALKGLCALHMTKHPHAFRYSLLETFSKSLSKSAALELESFFKKKLGSRAFGLNLN